MSTKTTTAAIAGVLALGAIGGTAYALNQPEPTETPAAVSTETPAPENTVEPTPSAEPTPEATTPVATPEPTYSAAEQSYIDLLKQEAAVDGLYPTSSEVLAWGTYSCEQFAAGVDPADINPPTGEDHPVLGNIARTKALEMLCPQP